ncbi:MAG: hypothetical protein ABSA52_23880 [Candidatus Binatia bacterium]|jgi:hypothetical protein
MRDTRNDREYLTPADVGRIAGVTPGAVRALTARGRLPVAAVTVGGVHLYSRETAEGYAAKRAARRRGGGGVADADRERS